MHRAVERAQMKQYWKQRISLGLVAFMCGAYLPGQQKLSAERTAAEAILPLSAELVAPLSARGAHPGALVLAKATQGWVGPGCTLTRGSMVSGHVVDVHLDGQAKATRLELLFDRADCAAVVCRDCAARAALRPQRVGAEWPVLWRGAA